tara:strand:- start:47 stop:523 length:477 start_codon:yes stop_codon:yes gene_type:complete
MKRIFNFGKIDYCNNGKKENLVTIEVEYKDGCFSASGNIWNRLGTDILSGGQNLDDIKKYSSQLKNKNTFYKIFNIWKSYHLNDMTAGSPKQMDFIKTHYKNTYDYDLLCDELAKNDLLFDKSYIYEGKPYRYGSAWLKTKIPTNIENQINKLIEVSA